MPRTVCTNAFPRLPEVLSDDIVVVTPHSPAAAALKRPKKTLQDLAFEIVAKQGRMVADRRVAAHLLREAVLEAGIQGDAFAMARRIGLVLRTILRVGIDTQDLERFGSSRVREVARIAAIFREKLRKRDLVHLEELVLVASTAPEVEKQKLLIYGYPRARKEEIALIDRIADEGSLYFLPAVDGIEAFTSNIDFAEQLRGRGWKIERGDSGPVTAGESAAANLLDPSPGRPDGVRAHKLHDVAAEVRFVLGEVKQLLRAGTPVEEIVVVARDLDLYAREFSIAGSEYSVRTRSTLKVPLSETLIGGFVSLLLRVLETGFGFEATIRFLGHPLGPGMSEESWRTCRRERTETADDWNRLEKSLFCLAELANGGVRKYAEWAKCLRSALAALEVRGRAAHVAKEMIAFNLFQEEISYDQEDQADVDLEGFSRSVREILNGVKTSFDPARLGVLITEPNIVVGGRFRHVFVVGMAEGVLPALPVDNPVIDFHERRLLIAKGIEFEEAADIPRWELLAFFDLVCTAVESLTLTYPATIGKEGKLESPYLERLGIKPTDGQPSVLCSREEVLRNTLRKNVPMPDSVFSAASRRYIVERRRESAEPHDEFDGLIGEAVDVTGRRWSVSQLGRLAGCGFQWFAGHVLRLRVPDEMDVDVSHAVRGKLFHYALHYAVSERGARTRDEIIGFLDEALEAGSRDPDTAMPRLPNWDLRRADYAMYLERAIRAADFLPDGTQIMDTEREFRVTIHGLEVRGRIDRIDRTPGGITAVDYKTSGSKPAPVSDSDGRRLDLQLAVYLAALRSIFPGEETSAGRYYSLSACRSFETEPPDDTDLREFLHGVVEAARRGNLPVRPVSTSTCTYCDYDQLCRNGARIIRKGAPSE